MPETLRKKPNKQKQISFLVTWFGLVFLVNTFNKSCVSGVARFSGLSFFIAPLCTRCCPFLWIVVLYCPLVYPVLPVSLDCHSLLPLVYPVLSVSLDCHSLFPPCVPGVARFSGLSFFIAPLCTWCRPFLWIVILYCPLVYPVLPVSLDCRSLLPPCVPGIARFSGLSFFIAPLYTRCCPFLWIVVLYCPLVYPVLPISLDCHSLLPPCVPGVARFTGLSFVIAPIGFL